MTFRQLYESLQNFVRDNPDHEALDHHVVMRIQLDDDAQRDLSVGGLRSMTVEQGCAEFYALILDGDQEPDDDAPDLG